MIRRLPRSTRTDTLFPYTTLFRSLRDARKGLNMFRRVDVPVLGIIENMSYFVCPHCQGRSDIFSHGGARREAEKLGMEFLGEVPLDMAIRETRSEERRVGKECVSKCRSRGSPFH